MCMLCHARSEKSWSREAKYLPPVLFLTERHHTVVVLPTAILVHVVAQPAAPPVKMCGQHALASKNASFWPVGVPGGKSLNAAVAEVAYKHASSANV